MPAQPGGQNGHHSLALFSEGDSCQLGLSFQNLSIFVTENKASVAQHVAHLLGVGKVMSSMRSPDSVIAKDVKSCT